MKFKTRYELKDREGEEKIIRKFLWFPTSFDDDKEGVWLDVADVVYKIKKIDVGDHYSVDKWVWRKERFATDEDYRTLPLYSTAENRYDMIEKAVRNPFTWIALNMADILYSLVDMNKALACLLFTTIIQAISTGFFGYNGDEK